MKKSRQVIKQYEDNYNGQKIIVNSVKPKNFKKGRSNARTRNSSCPCCGSKLVLNAGGAWQCTSDRLAFWEKEFRKFIKLLPHKQKEYITKISSNSNFFDLYDKWYDSYKNNKPEEFNCGYTNNVFLPISNTRTIIPDPIFCKFLEQKLKRPLTEEELRNEATIWIKRKKVSTKYFSGARLIVIPYIQLPEEETVR